MIALTRQEKYSASNNDMPPSSGPPAFPFAPFFVLSNLTSVSLSVLMDEAVVGSVSRL